MAEPQLQIERKVDELENQTQRNTRAISTMAQWLVQAQTGFGAKDAEGIEKILRGEMETEDASQEDTGRVSVREEGETVQGQGSESEGSETGPGDQGKPSQE